mmetsp:Transcript_6920/g.19247  ORF Transcript_6920/g.19247 Transcript_6920/m.19247 type:complete len:364 (+) Transcript_6920:973-2064(+)
MPLQKVSSQTGKSLPSEAVPGPRAGPPPPPAPRSESRAWTAAARSRRRGENSGGSCGRPWHRPATPVPGEKARPPPTPWRCWGLGPLQTPPHLRPCCPRGLWPARALLPCCHYGWSPTRLSATCVPLGSCPWVPGRSRPARRLRQQASYPSPQCRLGAPVQATAKPPIPSPFARAPLHLPQRSRSPHPPRKQHQTTQRAKRAGSRQQRWPAPLGWHLPPPGQSTAWASMVALWRHRLPPAPPASADQRHQSAPVAQCRRGPPPSPPLAPPPPLLSLPSPRAAAPSLLAAMRPSPRLRTLTPRERPRRLALLRSAPSPGPLRRGRPWPRPPSEPAARRRVSPHLARATRLQGWRPRTRGSCRSC